MAAVKSPDLNYSRRVDAAFYTQTDAANGVAPTEKMRITGDGNVGIGTTNPTFTSGGGLHIKDSSQANVRLEENTGEYFDLSMLNGDAYIINRVSDGFLAFRTNSTDRMRILSDGNVGIGDTTPPYPLTLEASVDTGLISRFYNTSTTNGQGLLIRAGETGTAARVLQVASRDDTKIMTVNSDGKVGIGVTAPTDTLAVSGGIKIGEFNSTVPGLYAGGSPPSDHNNSTGASDPQIRVAGRTSDAPGIIQMAFFDANNFFGGTNEFVLGRLQYAMNENSNTVTTVAEVRGVTSKPNDPGHFDGALTFYTSQGDSSGANLTEKMRLTADGYLGIGIDAPVSTLDIGTGGIFTLGNTRTALKLTGSQADLQLSHTTNAHILIDSTATTSDSYFSVRKDSLTASAATELFRVNENGIIKFNNAYDFPNAAGSTGDVLQLNGTNLEFASQTRMTKPAVFMDTGTQNVTQVETTVGFNSEILDAANNASISGTNDGHILLGAAGYYRISYSISFALCRQMTTMPSLPQLKLLNQVRRSTQERLPVVRVYRHPSSINTHQKTTSG
jgi:hypothetical protein